MQISNSHKKKNSYPHRNRITNPSVTLKLLRNFGHLISDLQINFALFNVKICKRIENYLAEYCSKSLSFLSLRCNPFIELFEDIETPFTNVYSLEMESCCFLKSKIQFDEMFPRLRFLQLDSNRYETRSVVNTAIPFLRSLAILRDLNEHDILESLKLNKQIEKLLLIKYTPNLIRSLNDCLPKLQCLCLRDLPEKFKYDFFEPIQFDNLRDFAMGTRSSLPCLPFTFNKLEHLCIVAPMNLDRKWFNLLGSFENLKRIGLFGISGDISELFELRNIRLETELMNIRYNGEISSLSLDSFLMHSRALKRITITSFPKNFHNFAHNIHTSSRCRITEFPEAKQVMVDYLVFDRRIHFE